MTQGPLSGLSVIEIGQYISGPYAAKLLADMGADVVKVESPEGDPMRRWQGGGARPYSPQFGAYNRGKRSVVLNLKQPDDLGSLLGLAERADVLIENFRPGVADRLGFGWPVLKERNPRLVYCSITGFGPSGPYAKRPAYDTVISAVGGMYSHLVPLESPRPIGPAFSDLLSGMSAAQGVLAALHARSASGEGQRVEVSMLGSVADFLTEAISTYLETGSTAQPGGRAARAQAYGCVGSDGLPFVVHMSVPEKFWLGLLDVLDRRDLASDPRFATRDLRYRNYDALDEVLKAETRKRPRDEWFELLTAADIPHGPLNTVADLVQDAQVLHMGLIEDDTTRPGTRFSTHERRLPRLRTAPAPALGAHNEELL
ncbi:CaiB/BaiF CoA transferase family protein [Sinosporangium siamense]|uniref:CoA transferase n=1 Tax=Sinosporangium siamense TaxID=1367973 RepID=A0A919V567_9ACTN|nr:CaiB/BaiF CoA-transferase family protein [Sinosporangium siamense]GII90511.1 CoA transferase [Sinosporangium siamense]